MRELCHNCPLGVNSFFLVKKKNFSEGYWCAEKQTGSYENVFLVRNGHHVKGFIFLKNRQLFIPDWFNRLMYSINTIIKCGTWQLVKFQLVTRFWIWSKKGMTFYRISELMLATLIQRYYKKIISFQEQETRWNFTVLRPSTPSFDYLPWQITHSF